MKFSARLGNGPKNNPLDFSSDPDHHLDLCVVYFLFFLGIFKRIGVILGCYCGVTINATDLQLNCKFAHLLPCERRLTELSAL